MQIDSSFWPLVCKCFQKGLKDPKVVPCQAPYMCAQIADSLQNHCAANEFSGMGWWQARSGKCSLVWAAMMVVPNCRCSLPTFSLPLLPHAIPHRPQPICSCLASQALHQVGLSYWVLLSSHHKQMSQCVCLCVWIDTSPTPASLFFFFLCIF